MVTTEGSCEFCLGKIGKESLTTHQTECARNLVSASRNSADPFEVWKRAVAYQHQDNYTSSESEFKRAADLFFTLADGNQSASRALLEYSTLMDAFSRESRGQDAISNENFTRASEEMSKASEILRSTTHFAFLAPYTAACGILQVLGGFESEDSEALEGYKSANALLEQAKFSLGFRDELHPVQKVFEAVLKYSISRALHVESVILSKSSDDEDLASDKELRSQSVRSEYLLIYQQCGLIPDRLEYFPLRDFNERIRGPLLLGYPEGDSLLIVNVGLKDAFVSRLGGMIFNEKLIGSMNSASFPARELPMGKIRVEFLDPETKMYRSTGLLTRA